MHDPQKTLAVIQYSDGRADGKLIGWLLEQARIPLGQLVCTNKARATGIVVTRAGWADHPARR